MPLYNRENLAEMHEAARQKPCTVFLFFGDRYLCRDASARLENILSETGGTVHPIDGEQEDFSSTIAKLRSFSLLPGRQIYRVTDTRIFHSKKVTPSIWNRAVKAHADHNSKLAARSLLALLQAGGLDPNQPDSDLVDLSGSEWQRHFGFTKPTGDLQWTRTILAGMDKKNIAPKGGTDNAELLMQVLDGAIPSSNILILMAEEVDKRKKLFKQLKENHSVIDLSVASGSSSSAQKAQKSVLQGLMTTVLKSAEKSMAPGVADLLFERVGFNPTAVVMETEKLICLVGKRQQISRQDLDEVVGRTRQEALFELTGAIGNRNLEQAMMVADRIQANGIHPLAVVATLRNYARSLLLFRSIGLQPQYQYQQSMSPAAFQKQCLPRLKEQEKWANELKGHPYALYMQFKTAASFSPATLQHWMKLLLKTELRLKGAPMTPQVILQQLVISMLTDPSPKVRYQ